MLEKQSLSEHFSLLVSKPLKSRITVVFREKKPACKVSFRNKTSSMEMIELILIWNDVTSKYIRLH